MQEKAQKSDWNISVFPRHRSSSPHYENLPLPCGRGRSNSSGLCNLFDLFGLFDSFCLFKLLDLFFSFCQSQSTNTFCFSLCMLDCGTLPRVKRAQAFFSFLCFIVSQNDFVVRIFRFEQSSSFGYRIYHGRIQFLGKSLYWKLTPAGTL